MRSLASLITALLVCAAGVSSFLIPSSFSNSALGRSLSRRACDNSASDRSCWGDYHTSTDYYNEVGGLYHNRLWAMLRTELQVPDTGVTRTYYLEITNTTASPDGVERIVQLVNGTLPGPTLVADWGDTVVVHVTNSLSTNGSSIHFHGIRQNYTNQNDGVVSITQCPTAVSMFPEYLNDFSDSGLAW